MLPRVGGMASHARPAHETPDRARSARGGAILAIAHPGHELLVHGWLGMARPRVFVLTDGSGRSGVSRLHATHAVLEQAGVVPGGLFGRFTDAALYAWILDGDVDVFVGLARELAKELRAADVDVVVGDAAEGYNPIHDAFRLTLDTAVALARRERPDLASYAFPLFGRPVGDERRGDVCIPLPPAAREAKRSAARAYLQLEREIEWSLGQYGEETFGREWLRAVHAGAGAYPLAERPPVYERYGEHLVRSGVLERVIRYEQHLMPIARALADAASGA